MTDHATLVVGDDHEQFRSASARLISKVRTIAAYAYRHSRGFPYIYPDPRLIYAGNSQVDYTPVAQRG